jgi:YfiH family protein
VSGLTLAIQVADCAAVLLWDENRKIIGALHAGWRGAVGEIIYIGIEKMMKQGASPSDMKAFISPCISIRNFEVGQEVADQFPPEFVDYSTFKKPHVDLKGFIKDQLMNKGLSEHNIEVRSECSVSNESFYSYRREGKKSGRMMALIQISDE